MTVHGIIVAAGSSTRFGGDVPKQLLEIAGRPVVAWSVEAFVAAGVDSIVVVASADRRHQMTDALGSFESRITLVGGGSTRSESVARGIDAVDGDPDDRVLIHDAARPAVSVTLVQAVIAALGDFEAVTPVVAVTDTLVEADEGRLAAVADRARYARVQTPQGFRLGTIIAAHRLAGEAGDATATDDAGLVHRYLKCDVALVPGETSNVKITTEGDLDIAEFVLRSRS